jgi:hypothetical protein
MSLLIFILLLSLNFAGVNLLTIEAQNLKNNASSNDTEIGGLSAESIDIAKANTSSDIIVNTTNGNRDIGGLSAESIDIAKANTSSDIIVNTTDSSTDFGGLSSKSVNSTN